jgi:two-component system, sensor histidine kinase and response regulator
MLVQETSSWKDVPVLVVDDNATNRRILKDYLLYWGMKPTTAESGKEALEAFEPMCKVNTPFSLVITDCMMPEMDGFQLVEHLNRLAGCPTSTIIMLTSGGEREDAARCLKLGITAYLLKPVKQPDLYEAILKALKGACPGESRPTLVTRHLIRQSRRSLNILVAEDHVVNQKLATAILQKMGHTVTVAENGKRALDRLEKEQFDLVLMDVSMPEMDGLEATRTIRTREKTSGIHVPIVAMTAYAMKGDKEKCIEAGMDGYVSKPIKPQELYATIERIIVEAESRA